MELNRFQPVPTEQKSMCPGAGMFSPSSKTLLHILLSACVFTLGRSSVQNQYKHLHTIHLKLVPQLQEDDQRSEGPATSTKKAKTLPSEASSVVLDQMASCDITMPNLIFAE